MMSSESRAGKENEVAPFLQYIGFGHTHGPITRRIVVDLSFLTALLLLHPCPPADRACRQWIRRGQRGGRTGGGTQRRERLEDRAWAAVAVRGHVECFDAPDGAAGERWVAHKVDAEEASFLALQQSDSMKV